MRYVLALLPVVLALGSGAVKKDVMSGSVPSTGRELYSAYCSSCHGVDGKGHGAGVAALRTPPPDLTALAIRNDGNFPYARVSGTISGDLARPEYVSREMPCFGLMFRGGADVSQRQVAALTEYIRTLQNR